MNSTLAKLAFNLFPPYWGTGITISEISSDFMSVRVNMALRRYNRNLKGSHFGGNLFSMTDPFYMVMLVKVLGSDYIVWDQQSTIAFRKPGTGTVSAHFLLTAARIETIKTQTADGSTYTPVFDIDIVNESEEVVAQVQKQLYIRNRRASDLNQAQARNTLAA